MSFVQAQEHERMQRPLTDAELLERTMDERLRGALGADHEQTIAKAIEMLEKLANGVDVESLYQATHVAKHAENQQLTSNEMSDDAARVMQVGPYEPLRAEPSNHAQEDYFNKVLNDMDPSLTPQTPVLDIEAARRGVNRHTSELDVSTYLASQTAMENLV